jgi:hypothetical protein
MPAGRSGYNLDFLTELENADTASPAALLAARTRGTHEGHSPYAVRAAPAAVQQPSDQPSDQRRARGVGGASASADSPPNQAGARRAFPRSAARYHEAATEVSGFMLEGGRLREPQPARTSSPPVPGGGQSSYDLGFVDYENESTDGDYGDDSSETSPVRDFNLDRVWQGYWDGSLR